MRCGRGGIGYAWPCRGKWLCLSSGIRRLDRWSHFHFRGSPLKAVFFVCQFPLILFLILSLFSPGVALVGCLALAAGRCVALRKVADRRQEFGLWKTQ